MKKAPGILPSPYWLSQHGWGTLMVKMARFPEAFAHIRQVKKYGKSILDHIHDAERIERQYGVLPHSKWLSRNGWATLARVISQNRGAFAHVKQDSKKGKSLADHVGDAKQLTRRFGFIPHLFWLQKNGYRGLLHCKMVHPEAFIQFRQDKKTHQLSEHVEEAKQLERQYGRVPSPGWLRKNGKCALLWAMQKHPKAFSEIKQTKPKQCKSLEEHVRDAKRLAKEHNGLPNSGWLRRSRFFGLNRAVQEHPRAFRHIRKQPRRKPRSLQENVKLAERLERKHGVVPNPTWLCNNGLSGLDYAMRKHPGVFAHIEQKRIRK